MSFNPSLFVPRTAIFFHNLRETAGKKGIILFKDVVVCYNRNTKVKKVRNLIRVTV